MAATSRDVYLRYLQEWVEHEKGHSSTLELVPDFLQRRDTVADDGTGVALNENYDGLLVPIPAQLMRLPLMIQKCKITKSGQLTSGAIQADKGCRQTKERKFE